MPISVSCPGCKKKLTAKDELAGKRVKCPSCKEAILIPSMAPIAEVPIAEVTVDAQEAFNHALDRSDPDEIARLFMDRDFILVETPEESTADGKASLTAEFDDDTVLVAFTSEEHVRKFMEAMPDVCAPDGTLNTFVVWGSFFLDDLPEEFGLMINPESDDSFVLPPELVNAIRESVREQRGNASCPSRMSPEQGAQAQRVRQDALEFLQSRGFRPAESLPLCDVNRQLRPMSEIAARLMGLATVFTWASAPSDAIASDSIRDFIKRNRLRRAFTDEEVKILGTPRAEARTEFKNSIGWKLENMWPLAWVLGFEAEPTIEASQINDDICGAIIFDLLAGLQRDIDDVIGQSTLRSAEEVLNLEDRFYCAHNAVRSAQLGQDTVPGDFHPVVHGGTVHERRHALTWCLSPGTAWDETDLST